MTPLRERMIQDMELRGLSATTQRTYVDAIRNLAGYYHKSPDAITEEELRGYFTYLTKVLKISDSTLKVRLSAIKFLFERTLQRPWPLLKLVRVKDRRRLPVILSVQEVRRLLGMEDILHCRTSVLGGHLYVCDRCGHAHYSYPSCRNRSCPKCHTGQTAAWLAERRLELLPVPYFHVVFTIPEELRFLVRRYQKELYSVLMTAAGRALMKLAADPHYVGGLIGILAVLHTWTGTLEYHPHVHGLVPAGGVSADRIEWLPAREEYLVPVKALSRIFRGIFRDLAKEKLPDVAFPDSAWKKEWVVFSKPAIQGPDKVLEYLGRYVYRVALTNRRILDIENGKVTFRYKASKTGQAGTMTLDAMEFIRRFLQHVLPRGVHKVRYYGLWSPTNRKLRRRLQLLLGYSSDPAQPPLAKKTVSPASTTCRPCPECGQGSLIPTARLPRQPRRAFEPKGRSPP